jgi:5-deoxy-D-glucuronate isomerase
MEKSRLVKIPKMVDSRGSLSFVECGNQIPFEVRLATWSFGIPLGAANVEARKLADREVILIVLAGSLAVEVHNGTQKESYKLDRPDIGLYVPRESRQTVKNLSPNTVVLALWSNTQQGAKNFEDQANIQQRIKEMSDS